MRWFKHFSDNHRGQSILFIRSKLGHVGVSCYYTLMELCAEKIERTGFTEENHFIFTFNRKYIENILGIKSKSSENILGTFQEAGVLKAECFEKEIRIEMPILLNLLDRDMRKPQIKRRSSAQVMRLERDVDKDKDVDKEGKTDLKKSAPLPRLIELWNLNCGTLAKVKTSNPRRNSKCAAIFKNISEDEWVQVIQRMASSDFCMGKNDRGWKATFDFLLQPETHLKVMEGKYDNRTGSRAIKPANFNQRPASEAGNFDELNRLADEEFERSRIK